MTYINLTWGHFFSHGTPVWPWPVIQYVYKRKLTSARKTLQ